MKWTATLVICGVAALVLGGAEAGADPGGYGSFPYASIRAGAYETPDTPLVLFDEETYTWQWGGPEIVGTAYALGDITTAESCLAKARSTLNYHDPFGSGGLSIVTDVETWKPFVVTSTVPADLGTLRQIKLDLAYSGTLEVVEGMPDNSSMADVEGGMTLYADDGSVIASRAGEADVEGFLDASGTNPSWTSSTMGCWAGLLTDDGSGHFTLNYAEQIVFDAVVGDRYWLYYELSTGSESGAGTGAGWAGSATLAEADFSSTGTYLLSCDDPNIGFVVVPEPATMALLVLGGLAVLRRRRS